MTGGSTTSGSAMPGLVLRQVTSDPPEAEQVRVTAEARVTNLSGVTVRLALGAGGGKVEPPIKGPSEKGTTTSI